MNINKINEFISVGAQITASEVKDVYALGYRSIICNRPDGEADEQALFADIEHEAKAVGIEICYLPVRSGMMNDENVQDFGKAIEELPKPIFAYCRSGTRCATLWALSALKTHSVEDIITATAQAGYNMSGILKG